MCVQVIPLTPRPPPPGTRVRRLTTASIAIVYFVHGNKTPRDVAPTRPWGCWERATTGRLIVSPCDFVFPLYENVFDARRFVRAMNKTRFSRSNGVLCFSSSIDFETVGHVGRSSIITVGRNRARGVHERRERQAEPLWTRVSQCRGARGRPWDGKRSPRAQNLANIEYLARNHRGRCGTRRGGVYRPCLVVAADA